MSAYDLSPEQARAITMLTDRPRRLCDLIVDRPPFATRILRACDYVRFKREGWIKGHMYTVALTPAGEAVKAAVLGRKRAFTLDRFEVGDLVTVNYITPVIDRKTSRVHHWSATTDSEYRLSLYPEDFDAVKAAGYFAPAFDSRVPQGVAWAVYVSREPDVKTGWRIAEVEAAKGLLAHES